MRVVNLRTEPCTHYCGRVGSYDEAKHGVNCNLGNPFPISKNNNRESVILLFEEWARSNISLIARIRDLPEDAVLGCWCKPASCHCDAIIRIWKELNQ
jgi:hypothetical protein